MKRALKMISLVLIVLLGAVSVTPVNAEGVEGVFNIITVMENRDGKSSYYYSEKGNQIYASFDTVNDTVTVNGKNYDIHTYCEAVKDQANSSLGESIDYYLSRYSQSPRATFFNRVLASPEPPTTGYGTEYEAYSLPVINLGWVLTYAALTAIAAYMTGGNLDAATRLTHAVRDAAIASGLITAGQIYNSDVLRQYYHSYHLTIYGAVRQRTRPYTTVQLETFWGNFSPYTYFWSVRPY